MTIAANTGHGDAALWQAAAAGEHAAFGQLFDRHATAVYNYLYRRTADWSAAEDLTAAVFLHAWRRRGEVVLDRDSALPWLLGVARLQLRNATRSRARYLAALSRVGREAMTAGGLAPCMRRARRSGTARSRCNSRFRPECVRATTNLGSVRLTGLTSRIGGLRWNTSSHHAQSRAPLTAQFPRRPKSSRRLLSPRPSGICQVPDGCGTKSMSTEKQKWDDK